MNTTVRTGLLGLRKKGTGVVRRPLHPEAAQYRIDAHLPSASGPIRARYWKMGPTLDQGQHGYCVGFGFACELLADPMGETDVLEDTGNALGRSIYYRARKIAGLPPLSSADQEGTTTESGAAALKALGLIDSYLWAHSIEDVRNAVTTTGPVVMATYWYKSFGVVGYKTDQFPALKNPSDFEGAHCMCITAYDPHRPLILSGRKVTGPAYFIRNSWGKGWGWYVILVPIKRKPGKKHRGPKTRPKIVKTGGAWVPEDQLETMLSSYGWENGAACLPVGRHPVDVGKILVQPAG